MGAIKQMIIPALLTFAGATLSFASYVLYEAVLEQADMRNQISVINMTLAEHAQALEQLIGDDDPHRIIPRLESLMDARAKEDNLYDWYSELAGIKRRQERGEELTRDSLDWEMLSELFVKGCRDLQHLDLLICNQMSDILE